jgi:7,8-dihydropterin-6-yl-methyl-4-(beta-D-ribofuranosyl)aminobenzene 5'-phosphate synthase
MKLTIVYDNEVFKKDLDLKSDWGFACLIKEKNDTILFDTGAKGEILLNNMSKLDINLGDITKIVISHQHWDHNGGLESLIPYVKDVKLYHLSHENPSDNFIPIFPDSPQKISENVGTTGLLKGTVDEQSLVLKGYKGWYVLTGCSHPGVENILYPAKKFGNIIGIIGGFHGFNNFQVVKDLEFICPCHCTAHKKDLKEAFPSKSSDCGVGKIIDI